MTEKLYPIVGYDNRYFITKESDIFIKENTKMNILPKFHLSKFEYVCLMDQEKIVIIPVDKLMLCTFIGNIQLPIIHLNHKTRDNRLQNLTYQIDDVEYSDIDNSIIISNQEFFMIPNYSNYYLSRNGIIFSNKANLLLKRTISSKTSNYVKFRLTDNDGKRVNIYLHKLVYEYFCGKVPDNYTIDHIDSNIMNNDVNNFQLLTIGENNRKMLLTNNSYRWSESEINLVCSLIEQKYNTRQIYEIMATREMQDFSSLIHNIKSGVCWKHISCKYNI